MVYRFNAVRTVTDEAERRIRLARLYAFFEQAADTSKEQDNSESAEKYRKEYLELFPSVFADVMQSTLEVRSIS
jgi:hypothetical protein